jgi:hypothetical protein
MLLLFTYCDFKNFCDFIPIRFDLRLRVEIPERDNSMLVQQPTTIFLLPVQRSLYIYIFIYSP